MTDTQIRPDVFIPRPTRAAGARTRLRIVPDPVPADRAPKDPRQIRDTVHLGQGGHKVVNLARGNELARELRAHTKDDPAGFTKALKAAMDDIWRIATLFRESLRALFTGR